MFDFGKIGIREWYTDEYPDDPLGYRLDGSVTFEDMFNALDAYQDIYKLIGIGDSLVRERLFTALSGFMDVPYEYVYDQWLRCRA